MLGDGDGGSKRLLGRAGSDGSRFEQDVAAQAMREGEIAAIFDSIREGQRFVDVRQCDVRAQRLCLELCEQHVVEPGIAEAATNTIGRERQRPSKVFRSRRGVMKTASRPPQIQFAPDAPRRHPVLPAESLQGLGRAQRGGGVAAQEFEVGPPDERMSHRWGVAEFSGAPARRVDQYPRAFRLAQFPRCHGEAGHRQGPGVVGEAFASLPVTLGVAGVERALAIIPRLEEVGGKETAQGEAATGDARLQYTPRVLRFLQERESELPNPSLLASHEGRVH